MSLGVGVGVRVGGSRAVWTPEKLVQPGDSWLLTNNDATAGITTHTSPDVSAGWAGAHWAGGGLGPYTHTAGVGNTAALAIAALIVGCRYLTRFTVSGRTAGSVTYYAGATAGAARSTNTTFTEELTCTTNTSHSFVPTEDFDGVVTVSFVRQMSSSALICKGNLGNLAQATAANMPWSSDADAPTSVRVNGKRVVYYDGSDVINAAGGTNWAFAHQESTVAFVFRIAVFNVAMNGIFGTGWANTEGIAIAVLASGAFLFNIPASPSGWRLESQTGAGVIAAGTTYVGIVRLRAANYDVRIDGVSVLGAASPALSVNPEGYPAQVGMVSSAFPRSLNGDLDSVFVISRYITDAECLKLEAYLRSYYAL